MHDFRSSYSLQDLCFVSSAKKINKSQIFCKEIFWKSHRASTSCENTLYQKSCKIYQNDHKFHMIMANNMWFLDFSGFDRICALWVLQKNLTSLRFFAKRSFGNPAELLPLAKIRYTKNRPKWTKMTTNRTIMANNMWFSDFSDFDKIFALWVLQKNLTSLRFFCTENFWKSRRVLPPVNIRHTKNRPKMDQNDHKTLIYTQYSVIFGFSDFDRIYAVRSL